MTLIDGGAAAGSAGLGPAGHDDEPDPATIANVTLVGSIAFDPFSRSYLRNADLTMQSQSPVIQRAAHLMLPKGALPATPDDGIDLDAIRRAAPEARQTVVEAQLRAAWKPLLDANLLELRSVTIDPRVPWNGRFFPVVRDLTQPLASPVPITT